jgi:hypothetical protein
MRDWLQAQCARARMQLIAFARSVCSKGLAGKQAGRQAGWMVHVSCGIVLRQLSVSMPAMGAVMHTQTPHRLHPDRVPLLPPVPKNGRRLTKQRQLSFVNPVNSVNRVPLGGGSLTVPVVRWDPLSAQLFTSGASWPAAAVPLAPPNWQSAAAAAAGGHHRVAPPTPAAPGPPPTTTHTRRGANVSLGLHAAHPSSNR